MRKSEKQEQACPRHIFGWEEVFRVVALLYFGGLLREGCGINVFTRKDNPPCHIFDHGGVFAVHGKCY